MVVPYGRRQRATPSPPSSRSRRARKQIDVRIELLNNQEKGASGELALQLPAGWTSTPASAPFAFARAGERTAFRFTVAMPSLEEPRLQGRRGGDCRRAAIRAGLRRHRAPRSRDALSVSSRVDAGRGVDVAIAPGLKIGYVMGIGDDVPAGIAQLGASVTLLGEQDLATGDLARFDAIVTGTRAYAVRDDLKTYNRRLLDYVRDGGNMIVLYNTQEFVPDTTRPFRRSCRLAPRKCPKRIRRSHPGPVASAVDDAEPDHEGRLRRLGGAARIEFFTEWDTAYTPLIATHDQGQEPQRWPGDRGVRQGTLHLLRLRLSPSAAGRCARRLPPPREPSFPANKNGRGDSSTRPFSFAVLRSALERVAEAEHHDVDVRRHRRWLQRSGDQVAAERLQVVGQSAGESASAW